MLLLPVQMSAHQELGQHCGYRPHVVVSAATVLFQLQMSAHLDWEKGQGPIMLGFRHQKFERSRQND